MPVDSDAPPPTMHVDPLVTPHQHGDVTNELHGHNAWLRADQLSAEAVAGRYVVPVHLADPD